MLRILLVDDHKVLRDSLRRSLEEAGEERCLLRQHHQHDQRRRHPVDRDCGPTTAARMLVPKRKNSTKAPTPNKACTIEGTPARLTIAMLIARVSQLSRAYSLR